MKMGMTLCGYRHESGDDCAVIDMKVGMTLYGYRHENGDDFVRL